MLIFWSLVRNSVVLAVYLLFSVACFLTVHEHYLQAGEPHCHLKNDKGIPRACYMTFIKPDSEWIYAGICFEGEDENRVPVKSLNDKFVHLMGGIL